MDEAARIRARLARQQIKADQQAVHAALVREMHAQALPDNFDLTRKTKPKKKAKHPRQKPNQQRKLCHCKKCGLPISFKKMDSGKWYPTNPDGSDHWDLCRNTVNASMPLDPAKDMKESGVIVGVNYVPSDCCGAVPPWECCPANCGEPDMEQQAMQHIRNI